MQYEPEYLWEANGRTMVVRLRVSEDDYRLMTKEEIEYWLDVNRKPPKGPKIDWEREGF